MNDLLASVRKWILLVVVICAVVAAGVFAWAFFELGGKTQEVKTATAETKAVKQAVNKSNAKVRTDLARAASTGQAREQDRIRLDQFFDQLAKEAADAPSAATDSYVLPADRLRIWRDANAGRSTAGQAGSEPDGSAATAAATGLGSDHGAGSQPPGGGGGLSPARVADMPSAGLPATANGGL